MFYLVSFLTLLAGLLIYMMDPVPTSTRRDLDVYTAEAYVNAFLVQHQAARDYMYQWLGRVFPYNNIVQQYDGTDFQFSVSSPNPKAISLPAKGLEALLPPQVTSEQYAEPNGNDIVDLGYLKFKDALIPGVNAGSYLSALICLDNNNTLTPCYSYECEESGRYENTCEIDSVLSISFANNVKPYVITYSINDPAENPQWWDKHGNVKPIRNELWRSAMANRAHSGYNCGFLTKGNWKKKLGKYEHVEYDGSVPSNYCIDNGNRCMRVLPSGIENFLKKVVYVRDNSISRDDINLDSVFVCMSEVKNPYIPAPTIHFDAIDSLAYGGGCGVQGLGPHYLPLSSPLEGKWYSVTRPNRTISGVSWYYNRAEGSTRDVARASMNGIEMPFTYGDLQPGNSTLIVVVDQGTPSTLGAGPNNGAYIGPIDSSTSEAKGAYALSWYNGNWYFLKHGEHPDTSSPISGGGADVYNGGMHTYAVVWDNDPDDNTKYRLLLYVNGCLNKTLSMNKNDDLSTANTQKVVIGQISDQGPGVASVRYYNTALDAVEIYKNFKVDSRRYGISAPVCTN
ncbi:MAG: hypothetical protein II938_02505 [Alphaproteobacteria bacterium]|nr:hypothetical protein [Alphaproteobacteria bacterium]